MWKTTILLPILLASACAQDRQAADTGADRSPAQVFEDLEGRLLAARTVDMEFQISSTGIVEVELHGTFSIAEDGNMELQAAGDFGPQPVNLTLSTGGGTYRFGNGPDLVEAPVPDHLREALVIGFMRMGFLHNLARLTGNAPPDHAMGGAGEWVVVGPFTPASPPDSSISFGITVSGEPAGSASLELSPVGDPVLRRQTVQFEAGEMRVVERYTSVRIVP